MVTVAEDTCGLHPYEVYFSSWGGVRAPRNPPWGGRCGLGPPLALEAPGEVTVPRATALPHPGPPRPPRALGGTGHHGPAQDPTWGLEHGPGCPPSLPGPWSLRIRRWDGGKVLLKESQRHRGSAAVTLPPFTWCLPDLAVSPTWQRQGLAPLAATGAGCPFSECPPHGCPRPCEQSWVRPTCAGRGARSPASEGDHRRLSSLEVLGRRPSGRLLPTSILGGSILSLASGPGGPPDKHH